MPGLGLGSSWSHRFPRVLWNLSLHTVHPDPSLALCLSSRLHLPASAQTPFSAPQCPFQGCCLTPTLWGMPRPWGFSQYPRWGLSSPQLPSRQPSRILPASWAPQCIFRCFASRARVASHIVLPIPSRAPQGRHKSGNLDSALPGGVRGPSHTAGWGAVARRSCSHFSPVCHCHTHCCLAGAQKHKMQDSCSHHWRPSCLSYQACCLGWQCAERSRGEK